MGELVLNTLMEWNTGHDKLCDGKSLAYQFTSELYVKQRRKRK